MANGREKALGEALLLLERLGALPWLTRQWPLRIGGVRFWIPVEHGVALGKLVRHEPWMAHLLHTLLPGADGAFVDVGANIGQTLLALKSSAPHVPYVGIEPNPFAATYLLSLIRLNSLKSCDVIPVAVGKDEGLVRLVFFGDDRADDTASTSEGVRPRTPHIGATWVPQLTFSAIWTALNEPHVAVVKIDVEGSELLVLEGMKTMLARERPIILCEVLPVYTASNSVRLERQRALEGLLQRDLGYRIERVVKSANGDFDGLTPVGEIGIHSDLTQCDYVFTPSERA